MHGSPSQEQCKRQQLREMLPRRKVSENVPDQTLRVERQGSWDSRVCMCVCANSLVRGLEGERLKGCSPGGLGKRCACPWTWGVDQKHEGFCMTCWSTRETSAVKEALNQSAHRTTKQPRSSTVSAQEEELCPQGCRLRAGLKTQVPTL